MTTSAIVSACLLGVKCRYNARDARSSKVDALLNGATPIPVCPEELGGLPTPRKRGEIVGGDGFGVLIDSARVIDERGKDITFEFLNGAKEVFNIATKNDAELALLKEGSPSCGVGTISRGGVKVEGVGVTTAILKEAGITTIGVS